MKKLALLLWFGPILFATCNDPGTTRSFTSNMATDLYGPIDTRAGTWGVADETIHVLTFKPPTGCVVKLLRLTGDFVGWPIGSTPTGTQAGVLVSMARTGTHGSIYADPATDGEILYRQGATDGAPFRLAFDQRVVDGVLNPDNQLNIKMADWLNNTGRIIHMEVTVLVFFQFVPPTS